MLRLQVLQKQERGEEQEKHFRRDLESGAPDRARAVGKECLWSEGLG